MSKKSILTLFVLVLAFGVGALPSAAWADQSGAAAAISSARSQIVTCSSAAKEAEAAGANITVLAGTLNEAGLLLSKAEYAFSAGDFVGAEDYAVQSQSGLSGFVSNANAMLNAAEVRRNQDFLINVVGSSVGTVAVLAGSLALWFFLNKKYRKEGENEIGFTTA